MNKKNIQKIIAGSILGIMAGVIFLWPHQSEAAWFDDSYGYRQKTTIGNSGSADTDKKVKLDVDTATLITASKMKADCSDTRFTDGNGKLLQYYIDTSGGACNTNSTDYYVVLPSINGSSNSTYIYMYYGNPSANAATQPSQLTQATFSPTSGPTFSSEEKGQGPVLYWKFDEGTNTTDSTQYQNNGTMSNVTWQSSDQCISGSCLKFNGSTSYVARPYTSDTELNPNTSSFTVSAWIRHPTTISGEEAVIARRYPGGRGRVGAVGYDVYMAADGTVCGRIQDMSYGQQWVCSTRSYNDNRWHFIEFIKTGSSSITLYIDSIKLAEETTINVNDALNDSDISVGADINMGSSYWNGYIDEVKIYNYAKSVAQIQTDYANRGGGDTTGSIIGAQNQSFLSNGLVGYWKMDESSWATDCSTASILDSSGNANNGKACPNASAATITSGKFGNAGSFDGTNDYVTVDNFSSKITNTNTLTISGWVYPPNNPADHSAYFGIRNYTNADFYVTQLAGTNTLECRFTNSSSTSYTTSNTITPNSWQFITFVYDKDKVTCYVNGRAGNSVSASGVITDINAPFNIGTNASNNYLNGKVDDVKFYTRALSDIEVRTLYDSVPGPVGWWKLDESTGTTANDSSGNGNTGTLTAFISNIWVKGTYGSALNFDGVDSRVSVTNAASINDIPARGGLSIDTWVYPHSSGEGSAGRIVAKDDTGPANGWQLRINSSNQLEFEADFDGATDLSVFTTTALTLNTWQHVAVTWDGSLSKSNVHLFINGIEKTQSGSSTDGVGNRVSDAAKNLIIGNGQTGTRTFDGYIDDVRIYDYIRPSKLIVSDMNAGHPAVGSPIASAIGHWRFNEGSGTTANNSGNAGSVINGTLTNMASPATSVSGWTNAGKFDKALAFDSSGGAGFDYVTMGSDASLGNNGPFTVSAWVNPTSFSGTAPGNVILGRYDDASSKRNYLLYADSSGQLLFQTSTNASCASGGAVTLSSGKNISTGVWTHVAGVYDGTLMHTYINGKEVGTPVTQTSVCTTATPFVVGARYGGGSIDTSTGFNGLIDEVKYYNYSLNSDQIKIDLNQGKSQVMGALSTASNGITADNSSAREYCVPGDTSTCNAPVGEWKLDENTGTTANDTSGNGRNGTLTATKANPWSPGKYGSGVNLDNTHDYITVADNNAFSVNTTNKLSVMGWVKYDTLGATSEPFNKGQGSNYEWAYRVFSDGSVRALLFTSAGGNYLTTTQSAAGIITTGQWYHLAMTVDTTVPLLTIYVNGKVIATSSTTAGAYTNGTATVRFGEREDGSNGTDGTIDNVLIYDYARTAAQVAWDYNRGGPIGWWKFDECQGTTAYDASGNGYNGTITPAGSGNTTAGTCNSGTSTEMWNNGTTGKYNSALDFDGTNDYVDIGDKDILNAITLSAWIYWDTLTTNDGIISKRTASEVAGDWSFRMSDNGDGKLEMMIWSALDTSKNVYSTRAISTGAWHHVAVSFDNATNTTKFYIDGVLDSTDTTTGTNDILNTPESLKIGMAGQSSDYFDGRIDDVRVYNYPLTVTQVKQVYNNGAVNFGPSTGSP